MDQAPTGAPWTCRRCGEGLEKHDHISGGDIALELRFRCRGTHLQQVYAPGNEDLPGEPDPLDDEIWYAPHANPYRGEEA